MLNRGEVQESRESDGSASCTSQWTLQQGRCFNTVTWSRLGNRSSRLPMGEKPHANHSCRYSSWSPRKNVTFYPVSCFRLFAGPWKTSKFLLSEQLDKVLSNKPCLMKPSVSFVQYQWVRYVLVPRLGYGQCDENRYCRFDLWWYHTTEGGNLACRWPTW